MPRLLRSLRPLLSKGVSQINAYDPLANETARQEFDPAQNILFEKIKYFRFRQGSY